MSVRTNTPTRRTVLAIGLAFIGASGCKGRRADATARCAFCGMRVQAGSHWAAGAVSSNGAPLAFDTPACLFRYRHAHGPASTRSEWVTEYYSPAGVRSDARTLRYVVGTDLVGPMGPDVIPVSPARVEGLQHDHHGRRHLGFNEVTPDVIHGL